MTRVTMKADLHHDGHSFRVGELVDLPDETARRLLALDLVALAPPPAADVDPDVRRPVYETDRRARHAMTATSRPVSLSPKDGA